MGPCCSMRASGVRSGLYVSGRGTCGGGGDFVGIRIVGGEDRPSASSMEGGRGGVVVRVERVGLGIWAGAGQST